MFVISENMEVIKHKTLLLDVNNVKLAKEEIQTVYPYPFELCDYSKIEKAVVEKDTNYFYLRLIWSDSNKYYLLVAPGSSDGKLLSKIGLGGRNFNFLAGSVFEGSYSTPITIELKHIEVIPNEKAQKVNNLFK